MQQSQWIVSDVTIHSYHTQKMLTFAIGVISLNQAPGITRDTTQKGKPPRNTMWKAKSDQVDI